MSRACTLAVILVAASSGVARASYLGIGIGTNTVTEKDDRIGSDGRSARLILGSRFGQFSIEGGLGGFGVLRFDRSGDMPLDAYMLSAAGKFSLPIGSGFEVFGRAGLHHTWADGDTDTYDVSGSGFLVGGGFEYRLNLGVGQGSIWVDYQVNKAKLENERFVFDTTSRMWTLGLSVGI